MYSELSVQIESVPWERYEVLRDGLWTYIENIFKLLYTLIIDNWYQEQPEPWLSIYERVCATNLVHDFAYRYIFPEEKFYLQSRGFKASAKRNYRVRHSANDASSMSNAGRLG